MGLGLLKGIGCRGLRSRVMGPENTGRPQIEVETRRRVASRPCLPLRILEFCKANAGGGAKWEDTRGATQGQARGWQRWGKGAGRGLEETPNLDPQLLREQEVGGAGLGSGVRQNNPDGAARACVIGGEGPPVSLPGLGATGPEKGRGGPESYVRSREARPGRQTEERFPHGNLGLGGMRTPFISGGTCGGGTLRRVARGAREVLSSSAAEAAAAATRMDFLSHRNSPSSSALPRAEGSRPPVTRRRRRAQGPAGRDQLLSGGSPEGKIPPKGQILTLSHQRYYSTLFPRKTDQNRCFASQKGVRHLPRDWQRWYRHRGG